MSYASTMGPPPSGNWAEKAYLKRLFEEWYELWTANGWTLNNGHTPRNSQDIHTLWVMALGMDIVWKSLEDMDHIVSHPLDVDFVE